MVNINKTSQYLKNLKVIRKYLISVITRITGTTDIPVCDLLSHKDHAKFLVDPDGNFSCAEVVSPRVLARPVQDIFAGGRTTGGKKTVFQSNHTRQSRPAAQDLTVWERELKSHLFTLLSLGSSCHRSLSGTLQGDCLAPMQPQRQQRASALPSRDIRGDPVPFSVPWRLRKRACASPARAVRASARSTCFLCLALTGPGPGLAGVITG